MQMFTLVYHAVTCCHVLTTCCYTSRELCSDYLFFNS